MKMENESSDIRVDVVIPVLNEEHVLEQSTQEVRAFLADHLPYTWSVVIVDNGSVDGTARIARDLANAHEDVEFIFLHEKGRGRALREAWQKSKADVVLYTDVDLSTELAALPKCVDALVLEKYDIAIGSRLAKGAQTKRCLKRELTSRIYNVFLRLVLFTRFSDAQCGFKAVTREIVDKIVPRVKDNSWFFDTELLVKAEKLGYKIKDIPVVWIEDDDSRVKIIPTAWEDIKGVFRVKWWIIRRFFKRWNKISDQSILETSVKETASDVQGK